MEKQSVAVIGAGKAEYEKACVESGLTS